MSIIKTYAPGSVEYAKLALAAAILTATSAKGYAYKVEDCYFDFGADWMHTTIIAYDHSTSVTGSWQALCPRDYEKILKAGDIEAVVAEIKADKWWRDR